MVRQSTYTSLTSYQWDTFPPVLEHLYQAGLSCLVLCGQVIKIIKAEVNAGGRAYIVLPLVSEAEAEIMADIKASHVR